MISFHSSLQYQLIRTKKNPPVAVNLQSPIICSNNTSSLLLNLQLCYKPLDILQSVIKNKYVHIPHKVLLSIFNCSVEKRSTLESSFSNINTSWKKRSHIISTEIFRMVINLSKTFIQSQSFFTFWNQKQIIFILRGTGFRERKLLKLKRSSKIFTQDTKAISNCIYPLSPSLISLRSILWYQLIGLKRNL